MTSRCVAACWEVTATRAIAIARGIQRDDAGHGPKADRGNAGTAKDIRKRS